MGGVTTLAGEGGKGAQGRDPPWGRGTRKALPGRSSTRPKLLGGGTNWLDLPLFEEPSQSMHPQAMPPILCPPQPYTDRPGHH